jgi:hypothetical protein
VRGENIIKPRESLTLVYFDVPQKTRLIPSLVTKGIIKIEAQAVSPIGQIIASFISLLRAESGLN